jgi:Zn-finger protein
MSYKFFENKDCEFYPCHKGMKEINCLFCYCPLYRAEDCGGNCKILENGVKDCSSCTFPHIRENYEKVIEKLK